MAGTTVLMVGTRKGLWVGRSDAARRDWTWSGPHLDMEEVYSCAVDTRGGATRLLAGASSMWLGPRVRRSGDLGATWDETDDGGVRFPDDVDASVERVWQLVPGAEPTAWCGPAPSRARSGARATAAPRSRSSAALWDHPHRRSGARASAARPSTRSCRTPPTPTR